MFARFAYTALFSASITLTACAADDGPGDGDGDGDPSEQREARDLLRSTDATTNTIALSADLSAIAVAPSFARTSASAADLELRILEQLDLDCVTTAIDADRVEVTLGACSGVTGKMIISFDDQACLDPLAACDEIAVSVEAEIEVEGLSISGVFENTISDQGCDAAGDLSITGSLVDDQAISFDLDVSYDGNGCELIDGTLSLDNGGDELSVEADQVLDCGGECADSGVLTATAGDESVTVDFDNGLVSGSDGLGNDFEVALDCSL